MPGGWVAEVVNVVARESRTAIRLYFWPLRALWRGTSALMEAYEGFGTLYGPLDPFAGAARRSRNLLLSTSRQNYVVADFGLTGSFGTTYRVDPIALRDLVRSIERLTSAVLQVGSALVVKTEDVGGRSHVSVTTLSRAQLLYLRKNLQLL